VTQHTQTKAPTADGQLKELVERAQAGDRAVLPALREFLDTHTEVWREAGDLARQAELAWLNMIAGKDLLLHESLERKLREMKAELEGPAASTLERLIVARIGACWLALYHAEAVMPRMHGATPAQHVAAQKRVNLCQQRYLQSIKALATIRKLLRPALAPLEIATKLTRERTSSLGGQLRERAAVFVGAGN
jgi:hypothetical protein